LGPLDSRGKNCGYWAANKAMEHVLQSDRAKWLHWRVQRLLSAGFDADVALALARHGSVDLHELLELVDRGCPPRLAARIVAPIDSGPTSDRPCGQP